MSQSGMNMKGMGRKTLGVWVLMLVVHALFGYILQNSVVEQRTGGNIAAQIRGHSVQLTQYYGVVRSYVLVCDALDTLRSDVWQNPRKGEVCSKTGYENVYVLVYMGEMLYAETARRSVGLMLVCIRSFQEPLAGITRRVWLENGRSRGTADDTEQGDGGRFAQMAGLHHFSEGGGCHRSRKSECCPRGSTALMSTANDVVMYKIMRNERGRVGSLCVVWGVLIHVKHCYDESLLIMWRAINGSLYEPQGFDFCRGVLTLCGRGQRPGTVRAAVLIRTISKGEISGKSSVLLSVDLHVHIAGRPLALSPEYDKYVLVVFSLSVLKMIRGGFFDMSIWPGHSTTPRRVGTKADMLEMRTNYMYILLPINMSLINAVDFTLAVRGLAPRGGGVGANEVVMVAYVDAYFFYIRSQGETQGYPQSRGCIQGVHQNPNTAKVRTPWRKRGHRQPRALWIDDATQSIVLGAILRVCKMVIAERFDLVDFIRSKDYQNDGGLVHYDATKAMSLKFNYGCITAQKGGYDIWVLRVVSVMYVMGLFIDTTWVLAQTH